MAHTFARPDSIAAVKPFVVDVPQATLDDLHDRLRRTRWPDGNSDDWTAGTSPRDLRDFGG